MVQTKFSQNIKILCTSNEMEYKRILVQSLFSPNKTPLFNAHALLHPNKIDEQNVNIIMF